MSWASSPAVRRSMRSNRRRDTGPELALRRILWKAGLRYRVDYPVRDGGRVVARPDVAFPRIRLAAFLDGCWWHACPIHHRPSKTNAGYWVPKIARNIARDAEQNDALRRLGWSVLRVWEHEPPGEAAAWIIDCARARSYALVAQRTGRPSPSREVAGSIPAERTAPSRRR